MRLLNTLRCLAGLHFPGRFCIYCGKRLDLHPLSAYRVRSRTLESLNVVVDAVDEEHAVSIAACGWHRANLRVELLGPAGTRSGD